MNKTITKIILMVCVLLWTGFAAFAQSIVVSGTVKDKLTNEPIPGVSVTVKGKTVGSSTDQNGRFSFTTTEKPPFTLSVTFVGYNTIEREVTGAASNLSFELESGAILGQEVVVSASRTPERILESPVTIERMGQAQIKEAAAPSFYDAIQNIKGVEMSTQSLTFRSYNTRGFNANGNTRFNQLIDGMDNQAPGLNFSVGNIVGITELDVDNVELLPGASSALYGAGGISGTLLMTSKDPFKYQGVSFQLKTGLNHVNDNNTSAQEFKQFDMRMAKSWNNKFGAKFAFSFLQAKDWFGTNTSNFDRAANMPKSGDRQSDPNYDGVNVYGDEVSQNMRAVAGSVLNAGTSSYIKAALGIPGTTMPTEAQINAFKSDATRLGMLNTFLATNANTRAFYAGVNTPTLNAALNQNVSRTGYDEINLVDYDTKSLKMSGGLYYNLSNTIQLSAMANWGTGTSVYTGSDRYSLRNFNIGLYKLELKGEDFYLRGYTTQERSGDSYISSILGSYINEKTKASTAWFPQYVGNYIGAIAGGASNAQAHAAARQAADANRVQPGSAQFNNYAEQIRNTYISQTNMATGVYGAKFNDKSNLYHYEGMYNFSRMFNNVVEFQMGASARRFDLNSGGTIFADLTDEIDIDEYAAFAQLGKKFGEVFKLTVAGRYDKSQNFDGRFTPRVTGVWTVAKNSNIRASFQTGFRNPTTQNQYIDLSVGGGSQRLIGGLPSFLNKYNLLTTKPYTEASYRAFVNASASGQPTAGVLKEYTFDPRGVRPESVTAYELGYKGLIGSNFLIDVYGFYNEYKDFITGVNVYQNQGTVTSPTFVKFGVPVNATGKVNTYGGAFGLDYVRGKYTFSGNVSYNKLNDLPADYNNDFNTPEVRYNLGISNREIFKNVGFNVNYRWQDKFTWFSSFAGGEVPAFGTVDAQVNLKVPSVNSLVKIGGSNILNKYYITSYGNPEVGAMYYVSLAFNP